MREPSAELHYRISSFAAVGHGISRGDRAGMGTGKGYYYHWEPVAAAAAAVASLPGTLCIAQECTPSAVHKRECTSNSRDGERDQRRKTLGKTKLYGPGTGTARKPADTRKVVSEKRQSRDMFMILVV